ncbi:uncharacterized protein TRAVEDRAFT_92050, partial [Trametes versicolor FP-101664 SS1]|uniref:uncharacterized protein n=1 Tax=Trametes versicolor (strain FP-101664) TaxID=717944 RepID=UPI0004622D6B
LTTKICVLPVVSRLPFCATPIQSSLPHTNPVSAHADFPNLVRLQSTALDELLDHSASGADLAVNLKQAELAVSDLVTLVRASNLTAKDVLADALFGFVGDAKVAGRGLQRLASKVHSVADTMSAFNSYAYYKIEETRKGGPASTDVTLTHVFHSSMDNFASQLTRIIFDGTAVALQLDALEERLAAVHSLCVQEKISMHAVLDDLLSELWTILGGNSSKLQALRDGRAILHDVEKYRGLAVAYVAATVHSLVVVDADLGELREKVNSAGFVGVPMEVQLASIERSIMRLR